MREILKKILYEFESVRRQKMKLYLYEKVIIWSFFIVCMFAVITDIVSRIWSCPAFVNQLSIWCIIASVFLLGIMVVCVNRNQRPQFNEKDLESINEILQDNGLKNEEQRNLLKEMIKNSSKGKEFHPLGTHFIFDLFIAPIIAALVGSFIEDGWLIKFEVGKWVVGEGMSVYLTIVLIACLSLGAINIWRVMDGKGNAVRVDFLRAIDEINCWEQIKDNIKCNNKSQ